MSRRRTPSPPLDAAKLEELALAYVARFSTTRARLEGYLARKLRERGWAEEGAAPVAAIAERFVELGYLDDAAYARARAGSLLRRGYGARRVGQALAVAGVAEQVRAEMVPEEDAARQAALVMARKRRFGPFGTEPPDRARREKQIAAMLRAGHPLDIVRELVDAPSAGAAEEWAAQSFGDR
ncbi:regulatory protein RecX [Novosphingobium marinum]|uniref:Regulatory protein RecX n=1 Tax=Novosphingobium marinum TaxID=1514948 RepID=A0A7Y9XXF2_9SPHN|nr:RecX family transcriptional regulator [Novosphingobium marinum]NYH96342.1 regulatory protein [Novosphingobium marinum]GGC34490.1 regulatory protein RecX [Novosphingobium marinum]